VLVEGPSVFICGECVEKAAEIVRESKPGAKPFAVVVSG
jgi:bacterioferritin-associated ferredoxin